MSPIEESTLKGKEPWEVKDIVLGCARDMGHKIFPRRLVLGWHCLGLLFLCGEDCPEEKKTEGSQAQNGISGFVLLPWV